MIRVFYAVLVCLACAPYTTYTPDPHKDIKQWMENFFYQRSFAYDYMLVTHTVSTRAHGTCVIGRGEHTRGGWQYADSILSFEYVGVGDIEYSKQGDIWHRTARGEESNIFAQIERLLEFDDFAYRGLDKGFLYYFKANIPFLAPGRRKEMIGIMKVSEHTFRPELLWAGLPDSSLFLQVRLYDYNRPATIDIPVSEWKNYMLSGTIDGGALERRLSLLDIDFHMTKEHEHVILTLPSFYTVDDVQALLHERALRVYHIVGKEYATRVGYVDGDYSKPVYLGSMVCDDNDIRNITIKFDARSRPYIDISFKHTYEIPGECAVEIDDQITVITALDSHHKIRRIAVYPNMRYYDMQVLRASLLVRLPPLQIEEVTGDKTW